MPKAAYFTTRLKLTLSVIAVSVADWKVPATVRGYVPAAVPGGSPPPPAHDGNVTRIASMHNKKINPHTRRRGFTPRLPGSTISPASPANPASPTNPAVRFPSERPKGNCKKPVAFVVVAVTLASTVVDPFSAIEFGDTAQVAKAGAPVQLSDTDCANPLTGARSTVKIAVCPGTTLRLSQVVVSEKFCTVAVMGTACGVPAALSAMLSDAVALPLPPLAVGVNVTLMVQLESASSEAPQLLVWLNSVALVPMILIELMVRRAFPVLLSVTGSDAVVPTVCETKFRLVGFSVTTGTPV